ncbi:hypothetical protein SASPL_141967 [Salvia splendens]|uniref:Translation initiation factor IF- 2 domain-containing protein n=1 Tax=Salvia splendens TaxID=180675 RepID=A0A8X8WKI7_SALSN|nr:hypothetical protein SASPL_141967 [Salvia splendens]
MELMGMPKGWDEADLKLPGKSGFADGEVCLDEKATSIITELRSRASMQSCIIRTKKWGKRITFGEGIPDLLLLLVKWAQKTMVKRLTYREKVQCTVLDVKVVEGHGTTIDVVLVNGVLHEGDKIVVGSMQGAIETSIRALLTPHPIREIRDKGKYLHHKEIKAAQCIKIAAQQRLEHASAGASLYVVGPNDDIESIKKSAMEYVNSLRRRISKSGKGVFLQASTLGSLEALLDFLETPAVNIPVGAISIGPVHMKDVKKVIAMRDKENEYGTILAFDVKVTPKAQELAEKHS